MRIRRLRGPCSAKRSLEMEEETEWIQISRSDQRSYIKIETLRGKNPTEMHNALHEVYGDSIVDRSTVSRWASRFREGRGKHPRRPKKRAAGNSNGQHTCGYRQHPVGRRSTQIM